MTRFIAEGALKSCGFRLNSGRRDRIPYWRLAIGHQRKGGRRFMQSSDDLCIDVAPVDGSDEWHVWVACDEPYRFIHVRHMLYIEELADLFYGLTGQRPAWFSKCFACGNNTWDAETLACSLVACPDPLAGPEIDHIHADYKDDSGSICLHTQKTFHDDGSLTLRFSCSDCGYGT